MAALKGLLHHALAAEPGILIAIRGCSIRSLAMIRHLERPIVLTLDGQGEWQLSWQLAGTVQDAIPTAFYLPALSTAGAAAENYR